MSKTEKTPHPIDTYVGANIRQKRRVKRMSQSELAEKVGLTFQQVQKYERGANRVSASMLCLIAQAMALHPVEFLPPLDGSLPGDSGVDAWTKTATALYARCPRVFDTLQRLTVKQLNALANFAETMLGDDVGDVVAVPHLREVA